MIALLVTLANGVHHLECALIRLWLMERIVLAIALARHSTHVMAALKIPIVSGVQMYLPKLVNTKMKPAALLQLAVKTTVHNKPVVEIATLAKVVDGVPQKTNV